MKAFVTKASLAVASVFAASVVWALPSVAAVDLRAASAVFLFDDGAGDTAQDSSSNGNNGTLVNGPVWVAGKFGGALEFNGTNTYVNVSEPVGLPVGTDPRTVALWFKWAEVQWPGVGIELLGWGKHLGTARVGVWLDGIQALGVEIAGVPNGPLWAFEWEGDTEWHHFAFAFPEGEVKSDKLKLYFDGQPKEGDDLGRPVTRLNTMPAPFTIGVLPEVLGFFFRGIIDEIAIFPEELGPADVAAIATNGLEASQAVSPSGKLTTSWGALKDR